MYLKERVRYDDVKGTPLMSDWDEQVTEATNTILADLGVDGDIDDVLPQLIERLYDHGYIHTKEYYNEEIEEATEALANSHITTTTSYKTCGKRWVAPCDS